MIATLKIMIEGRTDLYYDNIFLELLLIVCIDWENISAANFPYRIWQAPGPTNSLGRYKFNMPNSEA
ncbi:hypothetical protein LOS02_07460, partial [Proteus mirabilis]|uniref:hypothetical protein n=1 Tax=Proteus mirabilis TaxID=584 RepID=UPI001E653C2F